MDNKLSELSKPVVWEVKGILCHSEEEARVYVGEPERLYSQEYVSALLAELEASKKSNAFLKEQLAKLANFNPDWDMLEACRESWREVAAALKEAEARLAAKDKRIEELEVLLYRNIKRAKKLGEQLDTPVQLQNCDFESVAIMAHWCTDEQLKAWVKGVEHAKKQIRAAGFKVKGDE